MFGQMKTKNKPLRNPLNYSAEHYGSAEPRLKSTDLDAFEAENDGNYQTSTLRIMCSEAQNTFVTPLRQASTKSTA